MRRKSPRRSRKQIFYPAERANFMMTRIKTYPVTLVPLKLDDHHTTYSIQYDVPMSIVEDSLGIIRKLMDRTVLFDLSQENARKVIQEQHLHGVNYPNPQCVSVLSIWGFSAMIFLLRACEGNPEAKAKIAQSKVWTKWVERFGHLLES